LDFYTVLSFFLIISLMVMSPGPNGATLLGQPCRCSVCAWLRHYCTNQSSKSLPLLAALRFAHMKALKWVLFLVGYFVVSIGTPILATFALSNTICWKGPISGPVTAIAVVLYSYFSCPGYHVASVIVGFVFGAILAYQIPNMHWYPECHPNAYVRTNMPLFITYASGFVTLVVVLWSSRLKT